MSGLVVQMHKRTVLSQSKLPREKQLHGLLPLVEPEANNRNLFIRSVENHADADS